MRGSRWLGNDSGQQRKQLTTANHLLAKILQKRPQFSRVRMNSPAKTEQNTYISFNLYFVCISLLRASSKLFHFSFSSFLASGWLLQFRGVCWLPRRRPLAFCHNLNSPREQSSSPEPEFPSPRAPTVDDHQPKKLICQACSS